MTRYPVDAIAKHLNIDLNQIGGHQPGQHPTGITAIAQALNVTPRYLQHARRQGLTPWQADRYACRLGVHPSTIWPTWFQDTPDNIHGTAANNTTKTHCPNGHPYDHIDTRGYRTCRQCTAQRVKKCRQNRKHPAQNTRYTTQCLPGIQN